MNLYNIFRVINIIAGKKTKSKVLTPEQYEIMIHVAQLKHLKRKIGLPEEYQPGRPLPAQLFEITRINTMDLSPFKKFLGKKEDEPPLIVDSYGYATIPDDLYYPSVMEYKNRNIEIVSDELWNLRKSDALLKGTERNPIANFQNNFIRFNPLKNCFVDFIYLRNPIKPVFAYTLTKGYIEYDENNSIELEWNEINQIDIIAILLFDLGINIEKPEILQVAESVKTKGI